ncbi:RagB/SusD family nutrient uptake outer membrane protein [Pedobacter sp.]|uniref:RagB/SusD family nutrient uptake outer membrane protein n=1 Tax=Pedobacter sp. TaxID=1411316 RepID=UPI003BAD7DEE
MKTIYTIIIIALGVFFLLPSCKKALDKQDLNKVSPEFVFSDSILVKQQLDFIYDQNLPTWFGNVTGSLGASNDKSDEGWAENAFVQGTLTINSVSDMGSSNTAGNYFKIRIINQFIQDLRNSPLAPGLKKRFEAQALFFRAFRYHNLVRLYGGVPLVLLPLDAVGDDAKEAARVPRSKTSDCFKQITADLDTAAKYLPKKWLTADYGRITAGGALAYKGRVLLEYASPQYLNGDQTATELTRWEAAYVANKAAYDLLIASGYGLHPSYDNMWFTEGNGNPEAVMVTCFNNSPGDQTSKPNGYESSTRPAYLSTGTAATSNQPTWNLVQAYPMKDGKMPDANPVTNKSAYLYNQNTFYKNRDPRFDKTIAFNGSTWAINSNTNYRLWTYFAPLANGTLRSVEPSGTTTTGFYLRKAIDPNLGLNSVPFAGTDWMEIRFAEVVLNLAEAAAETGRMDEAFEGIRSIRRRAGIEPGADGNFGLDIAIKADRMRMINMLMLERQIEFAFEGKRFFDLRRRKMLLSLNGSRRTGIRIVTTSTAPASLTASPYVGRDGLAQDQAYTFFTVSIVNLDTRFTITYQPGSYFYAIPTASINSNPAILQNNNWGGSFDPLQ